MPSFKRLSSFEGYAKECEHDPDSQVKCSGTISPYQGETDSWGYEVFGLCETHYEEQLKEQVRCEGCHQEVGSVKYEPQCMQMFCTSCYNEQYE